MRTAMALPRRERCFCRDSTRRSEWSLVGDDLYVAMHRCAAAVPVCRGRDVDRGPGRKVVDLPAGTINHHWTKNVAANRDGSRLYVTVGSNSNVAENGMENESESRRHSRGRSGDAALARLRVGIAQPERPRLRPAHRRAVDRRQRARRARQRPRPRLPDVGAATAASTAGRTATTARMSMPASSRHGRTSWPPQSPPTTRLGRTSRRWG